MTGTRKEDHSSGFPWRAVLFVLLVLAFGVLIGLSASARAGTMTFALTTPCANGTVSRKGNDVIIRCGGAQWLYITNAAVSCPGLAVTRDVKGNLTVRCP